MPSKKVWILILILLQLIFTITSSLAFPRKGPNDEVRTSMSSKPYYAHQRNRKIKMPQIRNANPVAEQQMSMDRKVRYYLNQREHKLPLPSGAITVMTTEEGLMEHAFFLSYKMPRSVWNYFMTNNGASDRYLKVLDQIRVYKVYGKTPIQQFNFQNNIPLYEALETLRRAEMNLRKYNYPSFLEEEERKVGRVYLRFVGPPVRNEKDDSANLMNEKDETAAQSDASIRQPTQPELPISPKNKDMDPMKELQQYLEAKEQIRPLPTGKEKIVISETGLQNHAYFLSYKIPRPLWNQLFSKYKSPQDYLKVLDPERVQAVYGKKGPDYRVFRNNQALYYTIRNLAPKAVYEAIDQKETLEQLVEKDPRYTFPPNNEEVKETQLEDVLREISSQASTLEETSDTEQQDTSNQFRALPLSTTEKKPMESEQQSEALISTDTTTQEPINRQRRKDSVDYLKQIRDPFQLGLYLSYVVNENEYKKELQKAKEIDGSQSKWEEILDPLRVKEYYLYGPGTVVSEVFDEDPGLFEAINTVLVNYYETTSLPEQDPAILDKYPPVTTPVDPNRKFKDPLELAQYLSLQISMEELRELIAKAKTEGTLRQLWLSILNQDRVKNYFYQGKNLFFIERFQRHKDLFFAMRDHKLLPPVR